MSSGVPDLRNTPRDTLKEKLYRYCSIFSLLQCWRYRSGCFWIGCLEVTNLAPRILLTFRTNITFYSMDVENTFCCKYSKVILHNAYLFQSILYVLYVLFIALFFVYYAHQKIEYYFLSDKYYSFCTKFALDFHFKTGNI